MVPLGPERSPEDRRPGGLRTVVRVLTAGYWVALTLALVLPRSTWGLSWGNNLPEGADRLEHVAAFALLAVLVFWAGWVKYPTAMVAVLGLYALFTELVQSVVPSRIFDPVDLVANVAGIALGLVLVSWLPSGVTPADRSPQS